MSILKLAMEAPKLCGSKNADRYGKIAELVYQHELKNKDSVFSRNAIDIVKPVNRIEPAFSWKASFGNGAKKKYIMDLICYAMELHYIQDHGGSVEKAEDIKIGLLVREKKFPDVQAIQPVASVRSAWL